MQNRFTIPIVILAFFSLSFASAQIIQHEFGVRTGGLSNFGFIYKTKKPTAKTYKRFRAAVVDLRLINGDDVKDISAGLTFAIGFEHRHSLSDKFELLYGFDPYISGYYSDNINTTYNYNPTIDPSGEPIIVYRSSDRFSNTYSVTVGLGYVVGLQYQVMKNCMVGIETIPSIYLEYQNVNIQYENPNRVDEKAEFTEGGFRFNSNSIALSFIYQFASYKR